jgi:hypothetical protein
MLKSGAFSYIYNTLPYLDRVDDQIKISEAVNMEDIAWFEYFISRAKKSPKRGVSKAVAALEKNINDKKLKNQTLTSNQSSDNLDPQLDLSHRKIFGNSLKEVYGIEVYGKIDESVITNIKNFFARPKFNGDKLIVYHRTRFEKLIKYNSYLSSENNKDDVEELKDSEKLEKCLQDIIGDPNKRGSGFVAADGNLRGQGLYSCYTFKEGQSEGYGNIIIAFEVDISNYLIGDRNLAIRVHGTKFSPKQQFLKIIKKREPNRVDFFKEQWEDFFESTQDAYSFEDFFENSDNTERFINDITKKFFKGFIFRGDANGDVCISFDPKNDVQVYKIGVEDSIFQDHQVSSRYRGKLVWHDSLDSLLQGKAKNKDSFETTNQQKDKNEIELEEEESDNKIIADQLLGLVASGSGIYKNQINYVNSLFNKTKDFKDLVSCFEKSKNITAHSGKYESGFKAGKLEFQISNFSMNNTNMNYNYLDRFLSQLFFNDYNFYYKTILAFFENSSHKDFYVVNVIQNIIAFITVNSSIKIKSADANKIIKIINDNQEYKKYFLTKLVRRLKGSNKEKLARLLKDTSINLDLSDSDLNNLKFENKIYKAKTLKEVYSF